MIHGDILGERARLTPAKTALVDVATGARLTYADLNARAIACARFFQRDLGLQKGDRLGLLAGNSVEFLDVFFAAPKCGIVLVPLSTRLTPHELEYVVRDSGMRALIYDTTTRDTVRDLRGAVSLERWVTLDVRADESDDVMGERLAALQHSSVGAGFSRPETSVGAGFSRPETSVGAGFSRPEASVGAGFSRPEASVGAGFSRPGAPWTPARCDPEDLYCLLYTSGTTGRPKGVMIPHRMVTWNGFSTVAGWQLREDDVSPIFTPLYHAGALGAFLIPIFTIGGTIVLHRGFDVSEVWRTIEQERCTVVLGVPTIWKMLMEAPEFETADLSHVRWFISGGAPLPEYIIDAYQRRGVVFKQGYGLTEVGVNCFAMTVEESVRKKGSIGKPLMFTETRIADNQGREARVGEVGELWLRGPHVSKGYWNNPQATAEALDADGWFHTGDSARTDEDGFHYIAGRKKDLFISGGVNVYPAEIEGELLLHPDVQDAAVIGAPHPTWGEMGIAFIVARPGRDVSTDALVAHLEGRLARYKIPKEFVFVDALPRTPYGKVVKGDLQKQYAARGERGPAEAGPHTKKTQGPPSGAPSQT